LGLGVPDPPWSPVKGKSLLNLPKVPPLQGGICIGVDRKNISICPLVASRADRAKAATAISSGVVFMVNTILVYLKDRTKTVVFLDLI